MKINLPRVLIGGFLSLAIAIGFLKDQPSPKKLEGKNIKFYTHHKLKIEHLHVNENTLSLIDEDSIFYRSEHILQRRIFWRYYYNYKGKLVGIIEPYDLSGDNVIDASVVFNKGKDFLPIRSKDLLPYASLIFLNRDEKGKYQNVWESSKGKKLDTYLTFDEWFQKEEANANTYFTSLDGKF